MAENVSAPKHQNLFGDLRGAAGQLKGGTIMAEGGEHSLGPLTINTQSLESFGLGPNFVDLQPIGFGVNGLVVSAVDRTRNQRVAAKKIKIESQISCKYALREVRLLCQLKHENIIKVLDVLFDGGKSLVRGRQNTISNVTQIYTITELLDTNLNVLIAQNLLEAEHIKLITYQLLRGLHYLNSANVIHRDLKPSNLFINCDTLLLKIGDFGLARIVDTTYNHAGHLTADLGTYWYRAPELMISPRSYTSAVDMWSAGCILAEMLLGKPVFTGANDVEQLRVIIDSVNLTERDWSAVLRVLPNKLLHHHPMTPQRPLSHRLDNLDPAVTDLLEDMLVFDPLHRGTPGEALAHPYLQTYAKPDKEPIVVSPFRIESEVDDLPAPQLRQIIYDETKKRRGRRGLRIPAPSPIDRPKVSSATLSLKHAGEPTNKLRGPPSPVIDNLVKEQRRNRRSRLSTSVDLSFISLPSSGSSPDKKATPPDTSPQKVTYATKGFKDVPSQPCPWKWPVPAEKTNSSTESSSNLPSSEKSTPTSNETFSLVSETDPVRLQKVPVPKDSDDKVEAPSGSMAPPGLSGKPIIPASPASERKVRRRRDDAQTSVGRMKPKKRGFVDVGGFDEEDFIHLGLSTGTVDARRASDSLAMGGIETCPEKNQADIDRELNRRNKSASIDMTATRVPHTQLTTRPKRGSGGGKTTPSKHNTTTMKSRTNSPHKEAPPPEQKAPVITMHLQPPESSVVPFTLSPGDGSKRGSDVGIKIIKSPRSQRRVTCLGFERAESPLTPPERRWSSASYDRWSPNYLPERKTSTSNLTPISTGKIDLRKNSASSETCPSPSTSARSYTPQQLPYLNEETHPHRRGDVKMGGNGGSGITEKGLQPFLQVKEEVKTPCFTYEDEASVLKSSNEIPQEEMLLLASDPYLEEIPEPPEEFTDRPESVLSTLSIPALSPPSDHRPESQNSTARKVSQTTLFIEEFSTSQDSTKRGTDSRSTYASAEPSRCSSSLSIDLSCCVNKEQIKGEEEEKDQAEVSPRKQQEDWEIASQSSQTQKAEFTLSEILGVEEGEAREYQGDCIVNERGSTNYKPSLENSASKVCRTEIDLIPYQVRSPELKPPHCAFTPAPHSPVKPPGESDRKSPITKFERLSIDRDKKLFTTEFHFGDKVAGKEPRSDSRNSETNDKLCTTQESESLKDELLLQLPTDAPSTVPAGFTMDMARMPLVGLGRLTQHKSEEDLLSPRAYSPRSYPDLQSSRGPMGRDSVDLSDFKQSVKENLSSLKVSIPKDLPEKRRLVKAHSTESVCSEGEASTRTHDNITEDLIQFSPVGEAGGHSHIPSTGQHSLKESGVHELYHCNHCFYQGDCSNSSCGELGPKSGESFSRKNEGLRKEQEKAESHVSSAEISLVCQQNQPQASSDGANSSKLSTLDELCLSKDLFNERQKMKSCDTLNQSEVAAQELVPGSHKKTRPRSAKN